MSPAKGLLLAAAALMVALPPLAQAQEAAPADPPSASAAAPVAPAPAAAPAYSDAQMRAFARATVDLQLMDPGDVAGQTRAIETAGMSVDDYNRMGDAMRADPALASRLTPYLQNARAERPAISYRSSGYAAPPRSYSRSSRHTRHVASHSRKGRSAHASKRSHKASTSRHKASSSKRGKAAAHRTTTHRKRHR